MHQVDDSPGHVTMLSWNVLARPFTSYNQRFHRANGKAEMWRRVSHAGMLFDVHSNSRIEVASRPD